MTLRSRIRVAAIPKEEPVIRTISAAMKAMYICRGCGAEVAYPEKYVKCPVCGIKWG